MMAHRSVEWMAEGTCRDHDPELWFPLPSDPAVKAKEICAGCPVAVQCLEYALDTQQKHGVWGGLDQKQRCELLRLRRWDEGWDRKEAQE